MTRFWSKVDKNWPVPSHMSDAIAKGRRASFRGTRNGRAKLTEADVLAIRGSSESQQALASRYGVTKVAILYIKNRRNWRHVA